MAATVRSFSTQFTPATDSLTITKPSGVVSGDVLIAHIQHDSSDTNHNFDPTPPTGWTMIGVRTANASSNHWWYWKAAGGSEPASYTWSGMLVNEIGGSIIAISGADTTTPVETFDQDVTIWTSDTYIDLTVTTTGDSLLLGMVGIDPSAADSFSSDEGMTELYDISDASTGYLTMAGYSQAVAAGTHARRFRIVNGQRIGGALVAVTPATVASEDLAGGGASSVTVTPVGDGIASETASSGAGASTTITPTGDGSASEATGSGASSSVTITPAGDGTASEAASSGSGSSVTITPAGDGAATEQAASGSTATVLVTATGGGTSSETAEGGGGGIATVSVLATGDGSGTEAASDGGQAAVQVVALGSGPAKERASGGSDSLVTVASVADGLGAEHPFGGGTATVVVIASGNVLVSRDLHLTASLAPERWEAILAGERWSAEFLDDDGGTP